MGPRSPFSILLKTSNTTALKIVSLARKGLDLEEVIFFSCSRLLTPSYVADRRQNVGALAKVDLGNQKG